MSGVLATLNPRADDPVLARGPAEVQPEPSWFEAASANWRLNNDDLEDHQVLYKADAYQQLEDALVAAGQPRSRYHNPAWQRFFGSAGLEPERFDQIWQDVEAARTANPHAFSDIAPNRSEFERLAARRQGARDRDQQIAAVGGIGSSILPGLAFGLAHSAEPQNLAQIPLGGAGRTVAGTLLRQFGAGVMGSILQSPETIRARAEMGEGYSSGDMLRDATMGGAINAGAVGAHIVAGKAGAALQGAIPLDYQMARALERAVPIALRTPDEQAALHVVTRAFEVDASNPFQVTDAALDAHSQRLAAVMADLADMPRAAPVRAPAPVAAPAAAGARGTGSGDPFAAVARDVAASFGLDPVDVAAVMSYETGGTFNPRIMGGKGGRYMGLIQFGPEERARYGITAQSTPAEWTRAVTGFLHDRGFRQGMGLLDLYSTINAGRPGRYGASDGNGTVASHVERILSEHRAQAARWVGREPGTAVDPALAAQDIPIVRPEAMDAVRPQVTAAGGELAMASFAPHEIGVDAGLMQFKAGGDQFGVTERLRGVEQWDPISAGAVTVWEGLDGQRLIADGHQRLGLAKRIAAQDPAQDIRLNAFVLREADGYSAADARTLTALKNVREGSGSATDAAKVFRDVGLDAGLLASLPPRSALIRDGKALARLSDEAFGAVVNAVIPESHAAAIGHLAPDPATHMALVELLHDLAPPNRMQAEAVVRQALDAGFVTEHQVDMFGARDMATALFAHKARALDRTMAELRKLKGVFGTAARNADALDAAGNRIDVAASASAGEANARALALIDALALRKGNAVNDLFNAAAERLAKGDRIDRVVKDLVGELGQLDLVEIARGTDAAGGPAGGSGRADLAAGENARDGQPDSPLTPATRDELEAEGQAGFALFDEPAHKAFDDPAGAGVQAAADSVWHDIRAGKEIGAALDQALTADPAAARAAYEAINDPETGLTSEGGRVLNVDLARELSPEYRANRSRSSEVHEAASAFIKRLYTEKLAEPAPDGLEKRVLFTAGGTGAGKSSGLELVTGATRAGLIYDTNMNGFDSAVAKIDQALKADWPVSVIYTWRDPTEALVKGALPRAERMGRTVPLDKHIETHLGARETIAALQQHYRNDPRVAINVVDNSHGKGNSRLADLEAIPTVDHVGLYDRAAAETEAAFQRGDIGRATLDGTLGERAGGIRGGAPTRSEGRGPGAGGQPQPQDGLQALASDTLIDLDDGRGPRSIAEIDAELKRGEDGIDAIRSCL